MEIVKELELALAEEIRREGNTSQRGFFRSRKREKEEIHRRDSY